MISKNEPNPDHSESCSEISSHNLEKSYQGEFVTHHEESSTNRAYIIKNMSYEIKKLNRNKDRRSYFKKEIKRMQKVKMPSNFCKHMKMRALTQGRTFNILSKINNKSEIIKVSHKSYKKFSTGVSTKIAFSEQTVKLRPKKRKEKINSKVNKGNFFSVEIADIEHDEGEDTPRFTMLPN